MTQNNTCRNLYGLVRCAPFNDSAATESDHFTSGFSPHYRGPALLQRCRASSFDCSVKLPRTALLIHASRAALVSDHPNRESCHGQIGAGVCSTGRDGTDGQLDRIEKLVTRRAHGGVRSSRTTGRLPFSAIPKPTRINSVVLTRPVTAEQCRVQLAHPSGPASASESTVQGDSASTEHG